MALRVFSGLGAEKTSDGDPELEAIAALVSAADMLAYFTGPGTAALATLTAFARTLIDDPDAATMRATLGLGALATNADVTNALVNAAAGIAYSKLSLADSVKLSDMAKDANGLGAESVLAYRNAGGYTLTTGSVVVCDSTGGLGFDISSRYDVTTGKYTPQKKGVYCVVGDIEAGATMAADGSLRAMIFQNGAQIARGPYVHQRVSTIEHAQVTQLIRMNGTTDYLELRVEHDKGSALAINNGAIYGTSFKAYLIGRQA